MRRITGLIAVGMITMAVLAAVLAAFHESRQESIPREYRGKTPTRIIFGNPEAKPTCRELLIGPRVERICSWVRKWKAMVFADGSTLAPGKTGFRGGELNYTLVEVADLAARKAWVYEEADTEEMGLGHYRRMLENTSFQYIWLNLSRYVGKPRRYEANISVEKGNVLIPLAFFTYEEGLRGVHYYPAPTSYTHPYIEAAKPWCLAESRVLGVGCTVMAVDPGDHCTIIGMYVKPEEFPEITCGCFGNLTLIAVIEMPGIPGMRTDHGGFYMGDKILIVGKRKPVVLLHELGHVFGLPDIGLGNMDEKWLKTIFNNSAMNNGSSISLGDIAYLAANTYLEFKGRDPGLKIKAEMLEYGINVEEPSILLPLTPGGSLPPPINEIVGRGAIYVGSNGKPCLNTMMLKLMAELFREASITQQG